MTITYKNTDTNRTTTNATIAIYWMKKGYRVITVC